MSRPMQTIQEAATTTGWSPRMLRYVEQLGLLSAPRSAAGYRLYGPGELARLRSLRELIGRHGLDLAQVGFALRLRQDPELAVELDTWFRGGDARLPGDGEGVAHPRPDEQSVADESPASGDDGWLRFEQDKHQQLLAQ